MIPESLARFNYLDILGNLNFNVIYHEKLLNGRPSLDPPYPDWDCTKPCNYWDFDIELNGYRINGLIRNHNEINYFEYLDTEKEKYRIELKNLISIKDSTSDSLIILKEMLEFMEFIKSCYFKLKIFEYEPTIGIAEAEKEIDFHKSVKIIPSDKEKFNKDDIFIKYIISRFIEDHKIAVENTMAMINNMISVIEKNAEMGPNWIRSKSDDLIWSKNDTDLLELITSLLETRSITNKNGNLSRKDAIEIFSQIFNISIKDPESKLTRATSRKKDVSPYLTSLKEAFDNYAIKKEQRHDEIK